MCPTADDIGVVAARPLTRRARRLNAERLVRARLSNHPQLSVFGAAYQPAAEDGGVEVFVTIVARDEDAKAEGRNLLSDCGGLSARDWAEGWRKLELGDWLIDLYPERAAPTSTRSAAA